MVAILEMGKKNPEKAEGGKIQKSAGTPAPHLNTLAH